MLLFDDDPAAQIQRIRANLDGCSQTAAAERDILRTTIDAETRGIDDQELEIANISQVGSAVRRLAAQEKWYCGGQSQPEMATKSLYSTQTELRFEQVFLQGLQQDDSELTSSEALAIAQQLMTDLLANPTFAAAKHAHGALPLHQHGTPMWLADPDSTAIHPDTNIALLPARLGLAPRRARYVLVVVTPPACCSPKFADSGAYPYWRPGGKTLPIDQCPRECDGMAESVSDGVSIRHMRRPAIRYQRAV